MRFGRGPRRASPPVRIPVSVFAVGRRVYVDSPEDRSACVTLTDDAGKRPLASLADGAEVVILAWRPGWADTTRYRVRARGSGVDGWLPVGNLRGTEAVASAAPTAPPPPAVPPAPLPDEEFGQSTHRFGQRT